nr:adult cement protein 20 [Chelonibia testudinaria]
MRLLSLILLLCVAAVAVDGAACKHKKCASLCHGYGSYIGRPCGPHRVCARRKGSHYSLTCTRLSNIRSKHCVRGHKWCPKHYVCRIYNHRRVCFRRYHCRLYGQACTGSRHYCLPCGRVNSHLCCRPQFSSSSSKTCRHHCRKSGRCSRKNCPWKFRGYCCHSHCKGRRCH